MNTNVVFKLVALRNIVADGSNMELKLSLFLLKFKQNIRL